MLESELKPDSRIYTVTTMVEWFSRICPALHGSILESWPYSCLDSSPHIFNLYQSLGSIKKWSRRLSLLSFLVCANQDHFFLSHLYNSHRSIKFSIKKHEILKGHKSTKFKIRYKSYPELVLSFHLGSIPLALEESLGQEDGPIWSLLSRPHSG